MAKNVWNKEKAEKRIATRFNEVKTIEIKDYVRDTDLHSLPRSKAYRVDGVHLYADILNLGEMLQSTEVEGTTCHKRTLRFLNLHVRFTGFSGQSMPLRSISTISGSMP
mgnify:CR=1 FL=1